MIPPGTLIGTWRLLKFRAISVEEPWTASDGMGSTPSGLLIYSPDGYMSVLMSSSDPDVHRPIAAYSGRWRLDESTSHDQVIHHDVEVATEQDWIGQTLSRRFVLEDRLHSAARLRLSTLDTYGPPVSAEHAILLSEVRLRPDIGSSSSHLGASLQRRGGVAKSSSVFRWLGCKRAPSLVSLYAHRVVSFCGTL